MFPADCCRVSTCFTNMNIYLYLHTHSLLIDNLFSQTLLWVHHTMVLVGFIFTVAHQRASTKSQLR